MIKGAILAAGLLAVGATAASAETVFQGAFRITAKTAACQGHNVGDTGTAQFHPFLASQTDKSEGLSIYYQIGAQGYSVAGHIWDATFREAQSGGVGWGGVHVRPQSEWAQVRLVVRSPATITSTTPRIVLIGQIMRPDGNALGGLNCTLTFEADLVKYP